MPGTTKILNGAAAAGRGAATGAPWGSGAVLPGAARAPAGPTWLGVVRAKLRLSATGLCLLVLLAGGCARKLNNYNGTYRSAREMVRLKKAGRSPNARPIAKTKEKTKASGAGGAVTKTVVVRSRRVGSATGTLRAVIEVARSYQGTPYLYGGTTRLGLDCSGLLQVAFGEAGVTIPRSSNEQAVWGEPVRATDLRPGDLVFFGPSPGARTITHVGLVTVADDEGVDFIHASTSLGVVENSLESDYYLSRFVRAVRPRL